MKILVIGGGISKERDVSLRSSKAVFDALKQTDNQVELYDWDGSDDWLKINAPKFEVVFPVLHGVGGEDGQIQEILESVNCKYVGTNSQNSKICISKQLTRDKLGKHGILIPKGGLLSWAEYLESELSKRPHILKPNTEGSSLGLAFEPHPTKESIFSRKELFDKYNQMIVEELIDGQEITVPILEAKEMPVIEIIPPEGGDFDYENKYNGESQELCPPENVTEEVCQQAIEIAKKCHQVLGCRHLSRTDMIIEDDQIYVLETNTIPGMTKTSLFPKAARVAGMSMKDMCMHLVNLATKENL